jgi:hypothetical protein
MIIEQITVIIRDISQILALRENEISLNLYRVTVNRSMHKSSKKKE